MKNTITGKVLTKRDGSFKTFQYELNGEVLRKSPRYYGAGWRYHSKEPLLQAVGDSYKSSYSFGKTADSQRSRFMAVTKFPVIWEVTEEQQKFLPEEARVSA
jgi:hypothetical protein